MSFIMNMCHFDHLCTEMVGENLEIVPKSTTVDTNQVSPTLPFQDVKDYGMI